MRRPKLRDSGNRKGSELYPLAEFPSQVIYEASRWLTYNFAIGKSDISGEDWGDIFASAIGGTHLGSPVGLADVTHKTQAWSVKSVKHTNPHKCKTVRIISGRNSPDYSYDIKNPHSNIQETGSAVLGIWNERVNIGLDQFDSLRTCILVRNPQKLQFTLFEMDTHRYVPANYEWRINRNNNFEGYDLQTGRHIFTWQPHGSQFTIKYTVPSSAIMFSLRRPDILDFEKTMEQIGFDEGWITIRD